LFRLNRKEPILPYKTMIAYYDYIELEGDKLLSGLLANSFFSDDETLMVESEDDNWLENVKFDRVQIPAPFVARSLKLFDDKKQAVSIEVKEKIPFQLRYLHNASTEKNISVDSKIFADTYPSSEAYGDPDIDEWERHWRETTLPFKYSKFSALGVWEEKGQCILDQLRMNLSFEKYFNRELLP